MAMKRTMRSSGRRPSHPFEAGPDAGTKRKKEKPGAPVTGKGMPKGLATSKATGPAYPVD